MFIHTPINSTVWCQKVHLFSKDTAKAKYLKEEQRAHWLLIQQEPISSLCPIDNNVIMNK